MTNSANDYAPTSIERSTGLYSHVVVRTPDDGWLFDGHPVLVVHDTSDRVWIGCSYADDLPSEVKPVGDTLNNGYDVVGNRIVSVPAEWCTFVSDEDAENIESCIDADDRLRGYAT